MPIIPNGGATSTKATYGIPPDGGGRTSPHGRSYIIPSGGRRSLPGRVVSRFLVVAVPARLDRANHPEWWGYSDNSVWYPASWWWQHKRAWMLEHHPDWWGNEYQGTWYPASWWWQNNPVWVQENHPDWWGD